MAYSTLHMFRLGKFHVVSIFLMLGLFPLVACEESEHSDQSEKSMPSQSKKPGALSENKDQLGDLVLLNESEIKDAFIGHQLQMNREEEWKPNNNHVGFLEEFYPDGAWVTIRSMIAVTRMTGTWRIDNDQICTRITWSPAGAYNREEVCRQVWRDRLSGKIAMIDAISSRAVILLFSSSPLQNVNLGELSSIELRIVCRTKAQG